MIYVGFFNLCNTFSRYHARLAYTERRKKKPDMPEHLLVKES